MHFNKAMPLDHFSTSTSVNLWADLTSKSNYHAFARRKERWDGAKLREKCPYSELFWSLFSRIRTECGKILTKIIPNTDTFYAV